MQRTIPLASAAVVVLALSPVAGAEDKGFELDKRTRVLEPVSHAGLTIFPVVATTPTDDRDYLVLDEGMKAGTLKVHEKGDGEVNQLVIENVSDQPAFLMAGEVVIGGKQDRIIGKNIVIEPRSKEAIPVFCVEHGRWSGRKAAFSSANALAHKELRKKASFGSQSEVWQEVKDKNARRAVANDTDTYRRVVTDAKVDRSLASYQKAFGALDQLADRDRAVGYVVALDGEVVAIEVFGSPKLFKKLEPKLRKSYYVEAIDASKGKAAAARPAPTAAAVTTFHGKARAATKSIVIDKKSGKTYQFEDGDLKGSEVEGKDGGKVYEGAYH
jgi:hypothetical protein